MRGLKFVLFVAWLIPASLGLGEDWILTERPLEPAKACQCLCRGWIPAPVPTVGGVLRYEYGWSHLASAKDGYRLYHSAPGSDVRSCEANNGAACDGTDNSQQGWPHFDGNFHRCELYIP